MKQPDPTAGMELDARRLIRLKAAELLRQQRVAEAADYATTLADQRTHSARQKAPPRPLLACREGCAWCCHKRVGVSAVEVLRIASYLRANLSAEELAALGERLRLHAHERQRLAGD